MHLTRREYRAGDEIQVLDLWRRTYAQYGGYIVRSVEYWLWAVLRRPGMGPADILLVESNGHLLAYGALSPGGTILELAVDPLPSRRERRCALDLLLQGLEQQARERGYDFISCSAPASDRFIERAMRESGYHAEMADCVMLGIVDPLALIQRILDHRKDTLRGWRQSFLLELAQGNCRELSQTRLSIDIDEAILVADRSDEADGVAGCTIRTDLTVLTDVIFRYVSVKSCVADGSVTVDPPSKLPEARRLLDALSIKAPWHVPTSDAF